jgi:prophage tail gpP-like protein
MARPRDTVRVEAVGIGSFDRFTSLAITSDVTSPSEAAFEIGDDRTYPELRDFIALGQKYRVFVNERLVLTGRVELGDVQSDASNGAAIRFTVRTKLTDALFATASVAVSISNTTLEKWILALYADLGYTRDDFVFRANLARDVITGKSSKSSRELEPPEAIQLQQAKPQPPESIYQAVDRHLRRFGLMHWDSPEGKIVVSAPDDQQEPLYRFRNFRGVDGAYNNVLSIGRTNDYSEVPSFLVTSGVGYQNFDDEFVLSKALGYVQDEDLVRAGFVRPVTVLAEQMRTQTAAQSSANREMSSRSMKKDTVPVLVDGLSYWDGAQLVNYAFDTTADVISDAVGGPIGTYYVKSVALSRDPQRGDQAQLGLLKQGIWRLK